VREILVIHNPASRRGRRVGAALRRLLEAGGKAGAAHWVGISELPRAELPGGRLIVVGGDGTINAVASWLHDLGASLPLGIVPAGTGNNLARGLGLPLDVENASRLALESAGRRRIDAILYHGAGDGRARLIVQTAALGFPATIAGRYDALRRRSLFRLVALPLGPYVYRLLALAGLAAQKRRERRGAPLLSIRCRLGGGEILEEEVLAVFIGNEKSLGGNFHPCPLARMDDGALDLCLVRAGTGESYLRLFGRIMRGEHLAIERAIIYRQTPGPVEIALSEPSPLLADGDLWVESSSYRLEVLPGRLEVVTAE
jgi:diacylglycerol kinase (ATP)